MEEGRQLGEALATVRLQLGTMRKCLDADQLMDGLKSASTMLAELRTSSLSPKQYYELYMAVFDALRHLSAYLYDAHQSGKHHLADLYELVQYAGNIVPRLYLMITVGTVYMSVPEAPIKEIMKDMMEMARGVQHPTRGLFLRHYLSGMTRDHLPVGNDQGPGGNLYDSIGFVLTNFIEMNKLWVRLQHQGLSRDREKREMERKELRILVGTNLVRLSQLEGVDLDMYKRIILPAILEQVVNCKDVIAQEYLMEVVIQVFTDDFHLRTLSPFLSATAQLHPKVNIKQIVIALIDRLAAYAAREADNEDLPPTSQPSSKPAPPQDQEKHSPTSSSNPSSPPSSVSAEEKEAFVDGPVDKERSHRNGGTNGNTEESNPDEKSTSQTTLQLSQQTSSKEKASKYRGIPSDVQLFEVFWHQVVELIKARPDLSIQDITALLVSLINLSLSCYPDRIDYVDQVLAFAKAKVEEYSNSADLHHPTTVQNLLALLVAPINAYSTPLTLLSLPTFTPILYSQPYGTRRAIGHAIVSSLLKKETIISTPEEVKGILELCHVLVKDQKDANIGQPMQFAGQKGAMGSRGMMRNHSQRGQNAYDLEEMAEEQGWIARLVHLFRSEDDDVQFKLLQIARNQFAEGGDRIRWTFPPLIVAAIKLARQRHADYPTETSDTDGEVKASTLFRFIHQVISTLYNSPSDASEICLRLYLLALQAADESDLEELAYEFAVQAFTIYEESISESRAQLQAITLIIGTLQQARVFTADNYDTLITKAALHGAKLLKKGHQATAVMLASHLWWQLENTGGVAKEGKPLCRDGKRVLECLQKALRISTNCIDELTTVQLYVDALDQYIYYFERQVEAITPKHINSLVELITSNIDNIHSSDVHPTSSSATAGLIQTSLNPDSVIQHFRSTLAYLHSRKEGKIASIGDDHEESEMSNNFGEIDLVGSLLKMGL